MNYQINDDVFADFPKLETERLLLTAFVKSDAEELFKIRSDDRVIKYLDRPAHKNISESELMINTILQNYKDKIGINWMIRKKDTSEVIGYIGYWRLIRENVRAEIGYAISPGYWGNGFMQETLSK